MVQRRVRDYLQQVQVKQSWLARRMNLSEGALSLILAGKRKLTADELERLCAVLCVSAEMFVKPGEVDLPPRQN